MVLAEGYPLEVSKHLVLLDVGPTWEDEDSTMLGSTVMARMALLRAGRGPPVVSTVFAALFY